MLIFLKEKKKSNPSFPSLILSFDPLNGWNFTKPNIIIAEIGQALLILIGVVCHELFLKLLMI